MKMANKIISTALSLGLILSPIASVGAKDASKETVSPQKARVGTGTTAGPTDKDDSCREREARNDDDDCLKAGYIVTGIAAAALLAIVLEIAFDGKKDRGVTPPVIPPPGTTPPETTPPETTPPSTPPTTPPTTTTTTTTTTLSGN